MVSTEYSEAIVEVLDILHYSEDDIIEKIPKKLIEFWERNKSTTYNPNLDHSKPINEMKLKDKTKSLITMIYLNYLCDETQKKNTQLILKNNEEKYQKELREKYNPDNIFNHNQVIKEEKEIENYTETKQNMQMIEYKESFFTKIKNIVLNFFNKNKI